MKQLTITILSLFCTLSTSAQLGVQAHAGPNKIICLNDSAIIGGSPISTNTTPPLTISWTPNYNISSTSVANPKVAPATSTMYHLTVTDFNGRSGSDSVYVEVRTPLAADFDSLDHFCLDDTAYLLTEGFPLGGFYRGPGIQDSSHFIPSLAGLGSHTLWYIVIDTICNFSDSASQSTSISWPATPQLGSVDTICIGDTALLTAFGSNHAFYDWQPMYNISVLNSKGDSALVWPDSTVTYTLISVDSAGCDRESPYRVNVRDCTVGLSDHALKKTYMIYPNPAANSLFIETANDRLELSLMNASGQILSVYVLQNGTNKIGISELSNGSYLLLFRDLEGKLISVEHLIKVSP